jgi:histidinol dehydrogenase
MRVLSGRAAAAQVLTITKRSAQFDRFEPQVRRVVEDVRRNGDRALRRYAERWDGLAKGASLRVSETRLQSAWRTAPPDLRAALQLAATNIRSFCELQKPKEWQRTQAGISFGQLVRPLESVGCYVPGGRHPLMSTVLMTVIPAQVAGVTNIRIVSPQPALEVLAAAGMLGVKEFYAVGGAQAVAALAYGTKSIPRVNKIVGPGNLYVTAAKKLVSFDCAIDFLAGPTEVVVVSDDGEPEFIAADLVAQAEHDPEAMAIFITTSKRLAKAVDDEVTKSGATNPIARSSLRRHGAIVIAASRRQAMSWANQIAPEHLAVSRKDLPLVQNAGSLFVGDYSAQAAGDYASGPNHVLPTAGVARFRGGLSVMDFVKVITVQELSRSGLRKIASAVILLAEKEWLNGHANSVRLRVRNA